MRTRNKYKNKSCFCLSKHWHQSIQEANHCNKLLAMKQDGDIHDYKTQVKFSLDVNGEHICNHYVDFAVYNKDGLQHVEEVKGFGTRLWQIKARLFKAIYKGIDYKVVKKSGSYYF